MLAFLKNGNDESKIGNTLKKLAILVVIAVLGFIFQYKYLNDFPTHIHAWAQSDRYSLAVGFIENNFDLSKPQTFVYNHQFPHNWQPSESTITAVDFPIHDYLSAILMKLTGSTSPFIFRIYILLYSFIGLFFLFKLSYAVNENYLKSVFVVIFASTSPVFVYYQGGFLPSIPSLANAIIGIYFYYQYVHKYKNKYFYISIVFLTLAALSRTTFVIPLIDVLCVEFLRLLMKETKVLTKIIPVSISIISIVSYLLYNSYLREKYGSIFLNYLTPPNSYNHAKNILKYVYDIWVFQYFTKLHYLLFAILIIVSIYFAVSNKTQISKSKIHFALLIAIYLLGCFLFAGFMLYQFHDHDYYFIDSFFLPVIMLLSLILYLIPIKAQRNYVILFVVFVSLFFSYQILETQEQRRDTYYWGNAAETTVNNYKNSADFLDSIGVPKNAKILVMDTGAPNIPFLLMQRKGFAIMLNDKESIKEALKWNYDYIIIQNSLFINKIYKSYPDILSRLNKIADNGKISVCTLTENKEQSCLDIIGLTNKKPIFKKGLTFENKPNDNLWQNFKPTDKMAYEGRFAGHLTAHDTYGLTYKTTNLPELSTNSRTLLFSARILANANANCELVVTINSKDHQIYYRSYKLNDFIKKKMEWENVLLTMQLPIIKYDNYEFAIYILNSSKAELYYDNFEFSIY